MAVNLKKSVYSPEDIERELSITLTNGTYNPRTTFYTDFRIAERFGKAAIADTFKRAFREWRHNIVYLTELAMVVNDRCWHYQNNDILCELYADMYYKCRDYAYGGNFAEHEVTYYFRCTD